MSFIVAEYICPEHGKFDDLVERMPNGEAPDAVPCPCPQQLIYHGTLQPDPILCGLSSPWTISGPLGRVKLGEVSQGKVQKAEVPTWLDTEPLAERGAWSEWKRKRAQTWRDYRYRQNVREGRKGMG